MEYHQVKLLSLSGVLSNEEYNYYWSNKLYGFMALNFLNKIISNDVHINTVFRPKSKKRIACE